MSKTQEVVVGLDIGTSKVAIVAGLVQEGLTQVIGVGLVQNTGVRKGNIIDIEDTVSSVSSALEEAQRSSDLPLRYAFCGVGGTHAEVHTAKGVVAVSRADGEISVADVERVLEAARVVALPPNRELLHVIPRSFAVDGQRGIKDPLGMTGVRLEVESQVISDITSDYRNILKVVEQADLEIAEPIFAPLATAKTMLTKKQREHGVMLLDIGAGTTSMIIYEEGEVVHAAILPIGSMQITNDIAIGLRISPETAEQIKIKHGTAMKDEVKESETIPLSGFDPDEKQKVDRKYVADIIEARLNELFAMVRDQLKTIGKDGLLPAGLVLTGGGAQLDRLVDFTKEYLHLPATLGNPFVEVAGLVDKLDNPAFATSIGLMLWGLEDTKVTPKGNHKIELHKVGDTLIEKARHVLRQFLP